MVTLTLCSHRGGSRGDKLGELALAQPARVSGNTDYTHVVKATGGRTIYFSDQISLGCSGEIVGEGDMEVQAWRVFEKPRVAGTSGALGGCALRLYVGTALAVVGTGTYGVRRTTASLALVIRESLGPAAGWLTGLTALLCTIAPANAIRWPSRAAGAFPGEHWHGAAVVGHKPHIAWHTGRRPRLPRRHLRAGAGPAGIKPLLLLPAGWRSWRWRQVRSSCLSWVEPPSTLSVPAQ
jgi:hypothetical protein